MTHESALRTVAAGVGVTVAAGVGVTVAAGVGVTVAAGVGVDRAAVTLKLAEQVLVSWPTKAAIITPPVVSAFGA